VVDDKERVSASNFRQEFHGNVTLRQAIAKSMNIPTVRIGEIIGFRSIVDLARKAGLNMEIRPTPAVALGAYEVTPLEIAGAYTMYANKGVVVKPNWIKMIRSSRGTSIFESQPERSQVLDPRVNYLMVDLLQEVMRTGTAAGVRSRGFTLRRPARPNLPGWLVCRVHSKLVCVVWVGFDDNKELNLEGAKSALPIWTEFMKRAHLHREYRNVRGWDAPDGIVSVDIDPASGELATPSCPTSRADYFIAGTQPVQVCHLHGGGMTQVAGGKQRLLGPSQSDWPLRLPPWRSKSYQASRSVPPVTVPENSAGKPPEKPKEKRGFFGRIKEMLQIGVFQVNY